MASASPRSWPSSGARLVEVGTTNRTRPSDYQGALRERHGPAAEGAHVQLPDDRLRGEVGVAELRRVGRRRPERRRGPAQAARSRPRSRRSRRGRPRVGAARRQLPVARARPARLAPRRAGGAPDLGGRRVARDVQRRQAARRPPGRRHRRPGRPGRALPPPPAGPGPAARRAGAWSPCRRSPSPTSGATPAEPAAVAAGQHARSTTCAARARWRRAAARSSSASRSWAAAPCPAATIPSVGVAVPGDITAALRAATPPVVARVRRRAYGLRPAHGLPRPGRPPGQSPGRMRVVATAGHVDHGKSTLVWALTGTDPDRWAEEKTRGMTIDLGFASTTLPSGRGDRLRRRARARPVRQEHAGRRERGRRLPVRRRRHRGLEGPVGGAPAHPRAARHHPRPGRPDQGRPGRRRDPGAGRPGCGRALDRHLPGRRRDRCASTCRAASASTTCGPRSTASSKPLRPRSTATGPACGSTVRSRCAAPGTVVTGTLDGGRLAVDDELADRHRLAGRSGYAACRATTAPSTRPSRAAGWPSTSPASSPPSDRLGAMPWSGPGSGT